MPTANKELTSIGTIALNMATIRRMLANAMAGLPAPKPNGKGKKEPVAPKKGARKPKTYLTDEQRKEIRLALKEKKATYGQLAKRYRVSMGTIYNIKRGA